MPFKSDSQRKLCYLLKGKGQAGSWDCDEWSAATGKKKLPEHVEEQTEKKAGSLRDVKALCSLWASPSPIKEAAAISLLSKLSSVVTSPGRGSGDIEESAIDPDPSEGMQKAKPMPGRMGHKGGNKFVSPKGAARNALIRATKSVFGEDPDNRGIKAAAPYSRAFGIIKSALGKRRQGGKASDAAGGNSEPAASQGAIQQGQAQPDAASTPAAAPVNKNPTPSASSTPPPPAAPIQPAATPAAKPAAAPAPNPTGSGNWFTPANSMKQKGQAAAAAANTVGNAFGAVMGNQESLQTLNNDAKRPNLTALGDSLKGVGDKWDAFKKRTIDTANKVGPQYILKGDGNPFGNGSPLKIPERANFVNNTLPQAAQAASTMLSPFTTPAKHMTQALSSAFNDYAANNEGRRIAAGYALPAVNWMNSNPWSKYLGVAALGGLGLYGINSLMGGGNKNKRTGSVLDQSFQQGWASQQPR